MTTRIGSRRAIRTLQAVAWCVVILAGIAQIVLILDRTRGDHPVLLATLVIFVTAVFALLIGGVIHALLEGLVAVFDIADRTAENVEHQRVIAERLNALLAATRDNTDTPPRLSAIAEHNEGQKSPPRPPARPAPMAPVDPAKLKAIADAVAREDAERFNRGR